MYKNVKIIGGGLSGLVIASSLVKEGFDVEVIEKNNFLGGRASSITDDKTHDDVPIAPHVFVSAYNNLQNFFEEIDAEDAIKWQKDVFLEVVRDGKHHKMKRSRLPPLLYLIPLFLNYEFFGLRDKLNGMKFGLNIFLMSKSDIKKLDDQTALEYLESQGVNENVINRFMKFFSLSLLNMPLEKCSAAEFLLVMKAWMRLWHRDFGMANGGLGHVYTEKASEYIEERGGTIRKNTQVESLVTSEGEVTEIHFMDGHVEDADIVVSTLPPPQLKSLLSRETLDSEFFSHLKEFEPVPYISTFLWLDENITEKLFWSMLEFEDSEYANTDFYDKSNLPGVNEDTSYIMSNIIGKTEYWDKKPEQIIQTTINELEEAFPEEEFKIEEGKVHKIEYGIYAPKPGMRKHKRPHKTPVENFYLAGDWTYTEIPQCMEAAVRSGYKCSEKILEDNGIEKKLYNRKLR